MRVGIVGSRRFRNTKAVKDLVANLPEDAIVISGGCRGPDTWAVEAAKERGLRVIEHLPKYPMAGSAHWEYTNAYYARNLLIAQDSEVLHAFVAPDRKGGTENTIKHAEKLSIPIVIHELVRK